MDLSIIIPCFNHGHFLQEAIDSVLALKDISYEIIVVNDGSTDSNTINVLNELQVPALRVINQSNKGLAHSRNVGVSSSTGRFILPLDADNKIKPEYIYKALPLLTSGNFDVVYGQPILFGEQIEGRTFESQPFDILNLSMANYIDACAIYKREVWTSVSGYDAAMPVAGQEDWEFWIHAHIKGHKFAFLDEPLFYYRVVANSMIAQTAELDKSSMNHAYLVKKHADFYSAYYQQLYYSYRSHQNDVARPFRSLAKFIYQNYSKLRKN